MMEKIKNFYSSHPIRWTLLTLVVLIAVILVIWFFPAFFMEASEIPAPVIATSEKGNEITYDVAISNMKPIRKGSPVVVASRGGRTLTLDPAEMILTLKDTASGQTWSSAIPKAANGADKALLMLEYYGEDRSAPLTPINSYDNGTKLYYSTTVADPETGADTTVFSYYDKIYQIENGVRLELRILDNTKKYFAYMPQTLSAESYDFFISRIQELKDSGAEVAGETAFLDHYRLDPSDKDKPKEEQKYPFFTSGVGTSASAERQIISLAEQVGYTYEMLLADCSKFGTTALSPQLYDFTIVLEVTLNENGEMIARVPTNEIINHNEFFKLVRVHVLPNLFASIGDGQYLVPDGSGALLKFNNTAAVNKIDRPFMNNDYFQDYFWQSEYSEELMMPVYGVMFGGEETTHGMLGIIEQGVETANLHVRPDKALNKAYLSLDVTEMADVRIYGAYADNTASYKADSGLITTDFTIRFIPYAGNVTYYDMAMDYRDYLSAAYGKAVSTPEGPGLYLELLGAVTRTERFIGIPYDSISSMTTYAGAKQILEDLKGTGATIQYDGVFNGGTLNALNKGAELVDENGSESELQELLETAEANGNKLFFQMNISRVYDNGRNYIPYLHATRDFSNSAMSVYLYRADTAQMNGRWDPIREYTVVSPRYYEHLAASVREDLEGSSLLANANLAVGDLAHDVYADYRYKDIINPVEGRALARTALTTLAGGKAALSLDNPFADFAAYGDYAVNISRESSSHSAYYATVPFRQLALSGLTTVVSTDANLTSHSLNYAGSDAKRAEGEPAPISRSLNYYLMQAAELGVSVKYTVSHEDPDMLKNTHFESMYAIHWADWKDEILQAAQECAKLRETIGGRAIVNHEMLQPQVFQTTYEGDVKVITNYSALPYESTEGTVEAGRYLLIPAVQEGGAK